ncbi:TPA: hypothetical protein MW242_002632 [Acinetobacter baumannii]|nr:hypothetical protein [Acinetobacter baumannii]
MIKKIEEDFPSEKTVSDWLEKLIKNDELYDLILNKEAVDVLKTDKEHVHIPNFSFDRLSRVQNLKAATNVLDALKMLEIISVDKSVSLKKGEILRPDLVCFNPERRVFVVFEVKRDKLTERQALTEIYAYEQEIRNMFPFIGNREILTVVVSKDWDTLLEHAVSHYNSWSNKNCLALSINHIGNNDFNASVKIPDDWYFRGVHGLPPECFQTFDLFVTGDFLDDERIPYKVDTFYKLIVKQCDRNDIHGFIFLWKDYNQYNYGNWVITFCTIDPFAVFSYCHENKVEYRQSAITSFIEKFYSDNGSIASNSIGSLVSTYLPILKEDYQVTIANYCDWETKKETIKMNAKPIEFNFFGTIGDHVLEFTTNSIVRNHYIPYLKDNAIDWQHPIVASILINGLTDNLPYKDGVIRCSDVFDLGSSLGIYKYLVERFEEKQSKSLKNSVTWTYIELQKYVIENNQLYMNLSSVVEPPPLLSNIDENRLPSIDEYHGWILQYLLNGENSIHTSIYLFAFNTSMIMSNYFNKDDIQYFLDDSENLRHITTFLKRTLKNTIDYIYQNGIESTINFSELPIFNVLSLSASDDEDVNKSKIDLYNDLELIHLFIEDRFSTFDKVYPAVFHTGSPELIFPIDTEDAKKNIKQLYDNGGYPAISLTQNGKVGIALLDLTKDDPYTLLYNNIDFDVETIFLSISSGANVCSRLKWSELKDKFSGG